jgi:hypothetical protein
MIHPIRGIVGIVVVSVLAYAESGRAANHVGDQREDLLVGAPGEAFGAGPRSGVVYLLRGGAAGLVDIHVLDQDGLDTNEQGDEFGAALAAGDFDGDGLPDVAIGAPGEGSVFIYAGTGGGLVPDAVLDQTGDRFGAALVAGDFDGDEFDDLAVGAPNEAASGGVFLFRGGARGLTAHRFLDQGGLGVNEPDDRFGAALCVGDFDGDGRDDLAVGAPGEEPGSDPRSGVVFVFRGTADGLAADRVLDQEGLGGNEKGDLFGAALASGDFNGDRRDDLAVGAPGEEPGDDPQSGAVFVFGGTKEGLEAREFLAQEGLGGNETGDEFGRALSSGNYDGDDYDDLAVGAPGEAPGSDPKSGAVFIFRGSSAELVPLQFLAQEGLGSNDDGDRFGAALASGDYVGNHRDDLVVGAPGEAPGIEARSGAAFVFRGTAQGLTPQQFVKQVKVDRSEAGDLFAHALCE